MTALVSCDPGKARVACAFHVEMQCVALGWATCDEDGLCVEMLGERYRVAADGGLCLVLRAHSSSWQMQVVAEKGNINHNTPNWQSIVDQNWHGALVGGALGAGLGVTAYEPNTWKGQKCKPKHHREIWRILDDGERELFAQYDVEKVERIIDEACAAHTRTGKVTKYSHEWHNLLDAIGLGLFHNGRIGRGGRPAARRASR